jgi:hypothetical protein
MTEPYGYDENIDDDSDNDSDERFVRLDRSQIRAMEKDAKAARKAQQEAETLRRELAFVRAGVGDLTERQQKALFATIDGDITADAVRAAAEELGFTQPAAPTVQDDERQQMEQMARASAGATDPGSEDSVARLQRVAREGGKEAVLAQIQADGHLVTPGA